MKNLLLILVSVTIVFSSCEKEKEEESVITHESFSCKIEGLDLWNATINTTNSSGNVALNKPTCVV